MTPGDLANHFRSSNRMVTEIRSVACGVPLTFQFGLGHQRAQGGGDEHQFIDMFNQFFQKLPVFPSGQINDVFFVSSGAVWKNFLWDNGHVGNVQKADDVDFLPLIPG